jgi:CubicO group peptidase (beta-lactamase class C family)
MATVDFPFTKVGLPQLVPEKIPSCGLNPPCSREGTSQFLPQIESAALLNTTDFLKGVASRDPVFSSFQTPVYSNSAFQILSYALENITGKDFGTLMEQGIFEPLNLSHTSYMKPDDSLGVIPGDKTSTHWDTDLGELWP